MASLIPWRRRKVEPTGNGGSLTSVRDFPSLVRRMQSEFDELFDRFGRGFPATFEDFSRGWNWGLDVEDKADSVVVRAEAPGFEAGDFDIRVNGDNLILKASKKSEKKEKEGEVKEEYECYESVTLPAGVDRDKIDASYRNGVLTVTISKTKEAQGKKIAVKNS
jgi:HSP20 family protein